MYAPGPYAGTISMGEIDANFAQRLDADVFEHLVPALDRLEPPADAEIEIMRHAERAGIEIGNPVYEGRADLPRLLIAAGAVVLDFGCGFGTNTVALARDARHVFAIDRSAARVALTAARARAEGLDNVTAIHASGLELPLGDACCDAVVVIGVLEWTGVGSGAPQAAQARALAEAARVLRPGGLLIVAIENRFGASYFGGIREEHTGLRFISLLPRPVGRLYHRLARGGPYEALTHSRRALSQMVRAAGLEVNLGYVTPSYQHPQFSFDGTVAAPAKRYYIRHVFHAVTVARRLAARGLAACPRTALLAVFPSFWMVGRKGSPAPRVPTVVLGTAEREHVMKTIDWDDRRFVVIGRRGRELARSEPLLEGWNARRWVTWPLSAAGRRRRARLIIARASALLAAAERHPFDADQQARWLEQAELGLGTVQIADSVRPALRAALAELPSLDGVAEHGDLGLGNLVVQTGQLVVIDAPPVGSFGPPGLDACMVAFDTISALAGEKELDLAVAFLGLPRADAALHSFLATFLETRDAALASRLMLLAVLRHCAVRRAWPGTSRFLEAVGDGRLARSLAECGFPAPTSHPEPAAAASPTPG